MCNCRRKVPARQHPGPSPLLCWATALLNSQCLWWTEPAGSHATHRNHAGQPQQGNPFAGPALQQQQQQHMEEALPAAQGRGAFAAPAQQQSWQRAASQNGARPALKEMLLPTARAESGLSAISLSEARRTPSAEMTRQTSLLHTLGTQVLPWRCLSITFLAAIQLSLVQQKKILLAAGLRRGGLAGAGSADGCGDGAAPRCVSGAPHSEVPASGRDAAHSRYISHVLCEPGVHLTLYMVQHAKDCPHHT